MVLPQPADGPGPRLIEEGNLVIVYEGFSCLKPAYVDATATYTSRFGRFPHSDWLGRPFGARARSRPPGRGWVQLLAPTAELWTLALRHRTQILYASDIAMVVSHLDLQPGAVVLESGTGSASLTHSLARAVAPDGRVRSFEFHEQRAREAAAELLRNGLPASLASVQLRNVEQRGFPDDEFAGSADGIFLDLPGPWKVVPSAAACLKPNGRFCSFSPCIEQVQRTCEALDANGMTDIATFEVLLRNYEVSEETMFAEAEGGPAGDGAAGAAGGAAAGAPRKRARHGGDEDGAAAVDGEAASDGEAAAGGTVGESAPEEQPPQQQPPLGGAAANKGARQRRGRGRDVGGGGDGSMRPVTMVVSRPCMDARGHTGYLTFARKFL